MKNLPSYTPIRAVVIARAEELSLTAHAIAVQAKDNDQWVVWPDHVKHYLEGRKDMTSAKLDAVLRVLGLRVTVAGRDGSAGEATPPPPGATL